ncbi:RNA-directed DNA polymerase from mobile element jockey [Eumeta japonica]|uniref:RNA-directed DNA polymerase from mobile element jockey n=1 Tax=Eumeta variegata TaxID=151549 RepID=A0A4C1VW81_EUMVA|nr:RNA-directed DNA polymerase from mobile element jockey [Eumeta japonica]
MDWAAFQKFLETLHLRSSLATPNDVEAAASLLEADISVRDCRGAAWEETINHASESMKNLHQLNSQLTKKTTLVCSITHRIRARYYDAPARAEAIVEYLEGQFSLNLSATFTTQEHYAPVQKEDTPNWPLFRCLEEEQSHHQPQTRKGSSGPKQPRPITLLLHLAKIFERALFKRKTSFCSRSRSKLKCGQYTVVMFLDMEKAFDRVWHDGHLYKLLKTSLFPDLIKIFASFLRDRSFYVAVEKALSTSRSIHAGVPQTNCLSPSLFVAFTDDIPTL